MQTVGMVLSFNAAAQAQNKDLHVCQHLLHFCPCCSLRMLVGWSVCPKEDTDVWSDCHEICCGTSWSSEGKPSVIWTLYEPLSGQTWHIGKAIQIVQS